LITGTEVFSERIIVGIIFFISISIDFDFPVTEEIMAYLILNSSMIFFNCFTDKSLNSITSINSSLTNSPIFLSVFPNSMASQFSFMSNCVQRKNETRE